jgi:outer membrane lipoprotein SlyB
MVIGAIAGGLLGSTIGGGSGRTAATVVGAVAGGAVGNQVGKNTGSPDMQWQVTVRLDDGRDATVTQANDPQVRPGDYVQIRNNQIFRL